MRRVVRRVLLSLVVVVALGAAALLWGRLEFERSGPLGEETTVVLPRGLGLDGITRRLGEAGIVARPWVFALGVRLSGDARDLRAGEYVFPAGISARGVLELLLSGRTVMRRLTVPEGLTAAQVLELIAAADGLVGEAEGTPDEGALLPETYYFSYGDTRAGMIARMEAAMQAALDSLWPARAEGLPLATPREAAILASIVEKETALDHERAHIAGVFINRLRRGMHLQSDPTVVYALTGGKRALDRPLARADLDVDSPYNTYRNRGLPPTPIANPGRAALAAVLNPLATEDLYFVADGSGGHVFARTLEEHNRNVARWRALQAERGAQAE
ncbi:MAG: endolytic transglycosylase MltG [Alphaproteobacteria bacterium]